MSEHRAAPQREPRQRSIEELRNVVSMLCHFICHRQTRPGDHLWSIPVDPERDFDCILTDAIDELERLRAAPQEGETPGAPICPWCNKPVIPGTSPFTKAHWPCLGPCAAESGPRPEEEALALLAEITPGEWQAHPGGVENGAWEEPYVITNDPTVIHRYVARGYGWKDRSDVQFIAAAPRLLRALLDQVQTLREDAQAHADEIRDFRAMKAEVASKLASAQEEIVEVRSAAEAWQATSDRFRAENGALRAEIEELREYLGQIDQSRRELTKAVQGNALAAVKIAERHAGTNASESLDTILRRAVEIGSPETLRAWLDVNYPGLIPASAQDRAERAAQSLREKDAEIERLTTSIADAEGVADAAGFPEGAYLADVITQLAERERTLREALKELQQRTASNGDMADRAVYDYLAALSTPEDQR